MGHAQKEELTIGRTRDGSSLAATHQHRCRYVRVHACDTNYTSHGEDPDSWEAISLKEALFMPEGKASVLAAEAEADAVHDASSLRERKNGASSRVLPTISCRDFVGQNDCAHKLKREHITGDSAKKHTTEVVPTDGRRRG